MKKLNEIKKSIESDMGDILDSLGLSEEEVNAGLKLPDPHLRDFYKDENDRILWIDDEITTDTLVINYKIMEYNKQDKNIPTDERKPIKIVIDTMGGSVPIMWSIIKAIKMSKTPVWTINWCGCYSAGAHILAAGCKRFAMPGSTVLIHSGSCVYSGTQEQADNAKKFFDGLGKKANDQLLQDTKIDPKVFKKKAPSDWYLTEEEALENGIVDEILSSFDEIF